MFARLKNLFTRPDIEAASQLAPVAPLKVKPGAASWPAFFTSKKPADAAITRPERNLINTDVLTYRSGTSTHKVLQDFVSSSPELSNAVYTAVRLGVPERYTAVARDMDGTLNPEATRLLQTLLTRFDVIGDPLEGYTGHGSIKSCSESLARDMVMYGQMAGELVLGKDRLPYRVQPISSTVVQFRPDKDGVKPFQKVGSDELSLDVPTVVIVQLDSNLLTPYATSPIETALKAVVFSEQFMADLTRVMRKAIHPRLKVTIDEEQFRKYLSPEAQMDTAKANEEMSALVRDIENKVNTLNPEDALVFFDSLGFEVETPSENGDYSTLQNIANAKLASGSKTLPSVLGLESGSSSSNIASTQVATYIRSLDSSVRQKLNEFWSRLLTTAIRLMGVDGYVVFAYDPINIRPESELEAFYQTRQARLLEQLSLGMITDEECSLALTGKLPPNGYKPLMGTMFKSGTAQTMGGSTTADQVENPSNDGSTLNQKTKSDAPAQGRGGNKKVTDQNKAEDNSVEVEASKPTFVTPNITLNVDNTQRQSASVLKMKRDDDGNLIIERSNA